ncbi:MAG: GDSL-type esterase/lipase family protein [Acidimicrobiales bacterium]
MLASLLKAAVLPALAVAAILPVVGPTAVASAHNGAVLTPAPRQPVSPVLARPELPHSMAALGDSITQAFDATPTTHILANQPQYSWSTGYSPLVDSQYEHLLAGADRAIKDHYFDDAVTGSKMNKLVSQARRAAAQRARYVTILMGANDLCTHTAAQMTPVATFRREFAAGLEELQHIHGVRIFVSSIPNLYKLWQLFHDNPLAQSRWAFGICPSMLSLKNTQADRLAVLVRERADNAVLASVCRTHKDCRFDNLAVFDFSFKARDLSTIDYYHPSILGQRLLAAVTWRASFWPKLK